MPEPEVEGLAMLKTSQASPRLLDEIDVKSSLSSFSSFWICSNFEKLAFRGEIPELD